MARLVRTLAVALAVLGVVHGRALADERGVDGKYNTRYTLAGGYNQLVLTREI